MKLVRIYENGHDIDIREIGNIPDLGEEVKKVQSLFIP
jgi:hypothetical protein